MGMNPIRDSRNSIGKIYHAISFPHLVKLTKPVENSNCTTTENLEGKLVFWLRDYHRAETFKDPAKLPDNSLQELHIVANCLECRGTGKLLGDERCRYCEGRGTVWVIVSRKN